MQNHNIYDYIEEEKLDDLENVFRDIFVALANPDRIRILKLVNNNGSMTPGNIKPNFFLEESTITHHLNILKKAGLLKQFRQGRNMYYCLSPLFLNSLIKDFMSYIGMNKVVVLKEISCAG